MDGVFFCCSDHIISCWLPNIYPNIPGISPASPLVPPPSSQIPPILNIRQGNPKLFFQNKKRFPPNKMCSDSHMESVVQEILVWVCFDLVHNYVTVVARYSVGTVILSDDKSSFITELLQISPILSLKYDKNSLGEWLPEMITCAEMPNTTIQQNWFWMARKIQNW